MAPVTSFEDMYNNSLDERAELDVRHAADLREIDRLQARVLELELRCNEGRCS